MRDEMVLCYIGYGFAYFTSQPIAKQWGDDWNDAPYEHNAGTPYEPCWHRQKEHLAEGKPLCTCSGCLKDWDGIYPRWKITKIAFEGPFIRPGEYSNNSNYSVEDINKGIVPWLETEKWDREPIKIFAGETMEEFIRKVKLKKGHVYQEF